MIKKVEVLANIAVIITSVVVCTVLVRRYLLPSTNQPAAVAAASSLPAEVFRDDHQSHRGRRFLYLGSILVRADVHFF